MSPNRRYRTRSHGTVTPSTSPRHESRLSSSSSSTYRSGHSSHLRERHIEPDSDVLDDIRQRAVRLNIFPSSIDQRHSTGRGNAQTASPYITNRVPYDPPTEQPRPRRFVSPPHQLGPSALPPGSDTRNTTVPTGNFAPVPFLSQAPPGRLSVSGQPASSNRSEHQGSRPSLQSATARSSSARPPTPTPVIDLAKRPLIGRLSSFARPTCSIKGRGVIADTSPEMSMFNTTGLLQAKIEIHYDDDGSVDMLGGTQTGTNYSLPGHVILDLPVITRPSSNKPSRELRWVKLQVESMTEFFDDQGRYSPMRIFDQTLSLTHGEPIAIPNFDVQRPLDFRVRIAVPFDLRVPGWLPPSYITRLVTVGHGCQAEALIAWADPVTSATRSSCPATNSGFESKVFPAPLPVDGGRNRKSSKLSFDHLFANPSAGFSSRNSSIVSKSKYHPFEVLRHRLPAASNPNHVARTLISRPMVDKTSPVDVIMTIPEWVDVNGDSRGIKVQLRIRANAAMFKEALEERAEEAQMAQAASALAAMSTCSSTPPRMPGALPSSSSVDKLDDEEMPPRAPLDANVLTYVQELGMEVEETERYSSVPIPQWTQIYPTPAEQPDRSGTSFPLIAPRSLTADQQASGDVDARPYRGIAVRQCLLADDGSQRNYFFKDDGLAMDTKWRKVNVVLPMPTGLAHRSKRPSGELDSPFLRIRHALKLRIVCQNVVGDTEGATLNITVPIRFGTKPSTMPNAVDPTSSIPPYVQLFYENGDQRECDPLPLYQPVCASHQPPPFSPFAPTASAATPSASNQAPVARPPSVPVQPEEQEVPEPGMSYRTGTPDSRPPSPPTEEDDPMDGTYEDMSSGSEAARLSDVPMPDAASNVEEDETPSVSSSPALSDGISRLRIPSPPMLPEMAFPGALSPIMPRAYPYPGGSPFMGETGAESNGQAAFAMSGSSRSAGPGYAATAVPPSPTVRAPGGRKIRQPNTTSCSNPRSNA